MLTPDWQDAYHYAMGARMDHGANLTGGCESQLSTDRCADRTVKGRLAMAREAAAHARAFGVKVPAVPTRAADLEIFAGWLLLTIKLAAKARGIDGYTGRTLADIAAEEQAYATKVRAGVDSFYPTMNERHEYALTEFCPGCGYAHGRSHEPASLCWRCRDAQVIAERKAIAARHALEVDAAHTEALALSHCALCGEDISKPSPYGQHGCGASQPTRTIRTPAEDLRPGDQVLTTNGMRKVVKAVHVARTTLVTVSDVVNPPSWETELSYDSGALVTIQLADRLAMFE